MRRAYNITPSVISQLAINLYQNITFLLAILSSLSSAVSNRRPNREGKKILQHVLLEHTCDVRDLLYSHTYEAYPESKYRFAVKNSIKVSYKILLLSDSTFFKLFFHIFAAIIEALILAEHKFLYTFLIECGRLRRK